MNAAPVCALDDEMFTMRPHFASSMSGSTDWMQWNVPVRFTAMIRSHSSVLISMMGSKPSFPAPLTSTSTGPRARRVCSTASSTCARSETSTWHAIASPP